MDFILDRANMDGIASLVIYLYLARSHLLVRLKIDILNIYFFLEFILELKEKNICIKIRKMI